MLGYGASGHGNKRAALSAIFVFLGLNGRTFQPGKAAAAVMIENLAAGSVDENGLSTWISANVRAADTGE